MSVYIAISALFLASIRNWSDENKLLTSMAVTFVTALSYYVYHIGPAEYLIHSMGYWGYLSLAPLLSIILLSFIRCVTSTALMLLFVLLILTHLGCYLFELGGFYVDGVYQYIAWGYFALEIIILLSERVGNGFIKYCRSLYPSNLDSHHFHHWPKDTIGAIK